MPLVNRVQYRIAQGTFFAAIALLVLLGYDSAKNAITNTFFKSNAVEKNVDSALERDKTVEDNRNSYGSISGSNNENHEINSIPETNNTLQPTPKLRFLEKITSVGILNTNNPFRITPKESYENIIKSVPPGTIIATLGNEKFDLIHNVVDLVNPKEVVNNIETKSFETTYKKDVNYLEL